MKTTINIRKIITISVLALFLVPMFGWSQKRIKPPKRKSKVESVDQFVKHSFELYHKVFVYDSLVKAGVDVPPEIEDELVDRAEQDADSLWQSVPDIVDDISDASFMRQAKATLNLNKAKKALKYCIKTVKSYFAPAREDEDDKEDEKDNKN